MMKTLSWIAGVIREARSRADSLTVGSAMAVVAFCSGFISFTHISALTLQLGGSWKVAHFMPFCVDGQIVIGSSYFMYGENWKSKTGGLVLGVIPGIAESLVANWESGIAHGLFAAGWDTVPAQSFACSMILFERWLHRRREITPAQQVVPAAQPEAALPEPVEHAAPVLPAPQAAPVVHVHDVPAATPWGLAPLVPAAAAPAPEQSEQGPAPAGTSVPASALWSRSQGLGWPDAMGPGASVTQIPHPVPAAPPRSARPGKYAEVDMDDPAVIADAWALSFIRFAAKYGSSQHAPRKIRELHPQKEVTSDAA